MSEQPSTPRVRPLAVIIKALILLLVINVLFIYGGDLNPGRFSLYNIIFPGRERLPFGENPQSYNLSLFDLDAMFAAHELDGAPKRADEYRVIFVGDSSVWGILLTPGQTLTGQVNQINAQACGKNIRAYNLGYPTISLTKDLMLIDAARNYQPDLIVWLTTLEAFPRDKQLTTPLVAHNAERVSALITRYGLAANRNDPALIRPSLWDRTLVGQRRPLADLLRLQIYGALWAGTGVDQFYPESYPPAQTDFEDDASFHDQQPPTLAPESLAFDVLDAGMTIAPTLLVNEPMLISTGRNSDIRYNFFYPRWAYDQYRQLLTDRAAAEAWRYLDLWDLIPAAEFTNSAIHLTPAGERVLAEKILTNIQLTCK
jgi:hypothetical protein